MTRPRPSLARAALAVGGLRMIAQLLTWIVTLATVRLLTPTDYGLSGLAIGVAAVLSTFVDLGLLPALPAMPKQPRRVLGMAFGLVTLVSATAATLVVVAAPVLARLLGHAELTPLIMLTGVLVLCDGIRAVPSAVALRDFQFTLVARTDFIRAMVQSLATLTLAWGDAGPWSILGGAVAGAAASLGPLLRGVRLAPRWPAADPLRPVLRYARLLLASRMSWQAWLNADTFVIGRLISAGSVGSFNVGRTFAQLPMEKLVTVLLGVITPYFAEQTENSVSSRSYLVDLTELVGLVAGVPLVGMMLVAPEALPLIIGNQWTETIDLLRLLAPGAFIGCLGMLANQLVNARGRAHVASAASMVAAGVALPLYAAGALLGGVRGVAAMTAVVLSIVYLPGIAAALRETATPLSAYLRALRSFGLATIAMTLVVTGLRSILAPYAAAYAGGALLLLMTLIIGGAVAAMLTIWLTGSTGVERLRHLIRARLRSRQSAAATTSS